MTTPDHKVSGAVPAPDPDWETTSSIYNNTPYPRQQPQEQSPASNHPPPPRGAPISNALRPFHHLAHKLGAESPLPQDMGSEISKAIRILQSFTTDPSLPLSPLPALYPAGRPVSQNPPPLPPRKNHTLLTIPPSVLSSAVGLAVFTSVRLGLHVSGSTGSGILLARLPNGQWSPPVLISSYALGAGFLAGGDISDIVCVINSTEAMQAFTRTRVTLGPEVAIAAGPYGLGGGVGVVVEGCKGAHHGPRSGIHDGHSDEKAPLDPEKASLHSGHSRRSTQCHDARAQRREQRAAARAAKAAQAKQAVQTALSRPVFTYVRSRGLYAGVSLDGMMISSRGRANTSFYGAQMPTEQILAGYVAPGPWAHQVGALYAVLHAIEQRAPPLPPRPSLAQWGAGGGADGISGGEGMVRRAEDGERKAEGQGGEQWEELPQYEDNGVEKASVGDVKGH